jgi:hypothetical protein
MPANAFMARTRCRKIPALCLAAHRNEMRGRLVLMQTTLATSEVQVARTTTRIATQERRIAMLYTIAVVLLILWLLGLVSSYTLGGFIHVLLVIAIVVILLRVIGSRGA